MPRPCSRLLIEWQDTSVSEDAGKPNSSRIEGIGAQAKAGVLWSIVQMLTTRVLGFVSLLVLARLLVPDDFGVVAAIVVLLGFIEIAGDAGMKASVVYEQESSTTARVQTAFTVSVITSAVLTAVGIAVAPLLAAFFGVQEQTWLFRLAAVNILLVGLGSVQDGILLRDLAFRARLAAETLRATLRAGISIGLALAGVEAASLVWGMLGGTAVWVLALSVMTGLRPRLRLDLAAARTMGAYGAKSAALAAIAAVTTRLDAILIGRLLGERALGLYIVAFRVPELAIQAVAWQLSLVVFPSLSRKRVTDEGALPDATVRVIRLQALYVLPVATVISVLARPLMPLLFGPAWQGASQVLVPVSVLSAMLAVAFPLGDLLKATGRQGVLVALNVASIPLLVGVMTAAASRGLAAVAWARVGTTALFVTALIVATSRLAAVPGRRVIRALGPGCVAAIGALAGTGGVRVLWTSVSVPAVAGAFMAGFACATALVALCAPAAWADARASVPVPAALRRRRASPAIVGSRGNGPS